jgi:hypothetical protein
LDKIKDKKNKKQIKSDVGNSNYKTVLLPLPISLHSKLKGRAYENGVGFYDFLLKILEKAS